MKGATTEFNYVLFFLFRKKSIRIDPHLVVMSDIKNSYIPKKTKEFYLFFIPTKQLSIVEFL